MSQMGLQKSNDGQTILIITPSAYRIAKDLKERTKSQEQSQNKTRKETTDSTY